MTEKPYNVLIIIYKNKNLNQFFKIFFNVINKKHFLMLYIKKIFKHDKLSVTRPVLSKNDIFWIEKIRTILLIK